MELIWNNKPQAPSEGSFRFYAWIYLFNSPFTKTAALDRTHCLRQGWGWGWGGLMVEGFCVVNLRVLLDGGDFFKQALA